jgi:hypothetical protein
MQVRRLRLLICGLVGLCILAGIAALVTLLNDRSEGPVYRGKHVGIWFREYAFSSNATVRTVAVKVRADGRIVLTQIRAGRQVDIVMSTNSPGFPALLSAQTAVGWPSTGDPAWNALQAIGTNAVPYLVGQLHGIPFEPTYTRAFTNLPVVLQKKLPHPGERHYLRLKALEVLGRIGDPSGTATPVLLDFLRKRDRLSQPVLYGALRTLGVDRRLISPVVLELGAKGCHEDVLDITESLGWKGDEVTELLGTILKSPDVTLRRRAIVLLERSGKAAAPASDAVRLALNDSDGEVRYLSARTLEAMGASSAEVADALRASLNDSNVMVQTVARRILLRIAAETLPVGAREQATTAAP